MDTSQFRDESISSGIVRFLGFLRILVVLGRTDNLDSSLVNGTFHK